MRAIAADCDGDALLILAEPRGPACHQGTPSCFGAGAPQTAAQPYGFLGALTRTIRERIDARRGDARRGDARQSGSYTIKLLDEGPQRIAQKVGEEGLELALASVAQGESEVINEAADLLYHVVLLLEAKGLSLARVVAELEARGNRGG